MNSRAFAGAMAFTQLFATALLLLPVAIPQEVAAKGVSHQVDAIAVSDEAINGKNFSVSKITVHAPQDHVWGILTDYANSTKVFPQMRKCEILHTKGNVKTLKHQIQPGGMAGCATYNYVVEVTEHAPKSIEWHRLSGDFKAVDGFWRLEPTNEGQDTIVTYSAYVNGGFFIPQMLIKKQFRVDMPVVLSNLKSESESIRIAKKPDSARLQ